MCLGFPKPIPPVPPKHQRTISKPQTGTTGMSQPVPSHYFGALQPPPQQTTTSKVNCVLGGPARPHKPSSWAPNQKTVSQTTPRPSFWGPSKNNDKGPSRAPKPTPNLLPNPKTLFVGPKAPPGPKQEASWGLAPPQANKKKSLQGEAGAGPMKGEVLGAPFGGPPVFGGPCRPPKYVFSSGWSWGLLGCWGPCRPPKS